MRGQRTGEDAGSAGDVEEPPASSQIERRGQRARRQQPAAVHRGKELLREGLGLHRAMPIGLVFAPRKARGLAGSQHLDQIDGNRAIRELRKIRSEEPGRAGDEMLARDIGCPQHRTIPMQQAHCHEQRRHHVDRPRVEPESAGDVADASWMRVDPREEVEPREGGDEHVRRVELVADSVQRGRIGRGRACQVVHLVGTVEYTVLQTVFLDAGGVLMFPNWTRIEEALARQGVRVAADALARAEPHARKTLDDSRTIGTTTDASRGWLFFDLILERAGIARSEATAAALAELHAYHQLNNLWELVPAGVKPALAALRARGLTLVVVSNANGTLRAHMARLGLDGMVDHVIDSCDEGVEKPDPRLFQIALARAGAAVESTIHVGDIYQVDVVGARAAGLRAVLLDEAGLHAHADCPRVGSLEELVEQIHGGVFD
jgi:putative hydrolase of the HAD superfamily